MIRLALVLCLGASSLALRNPPNVTILKMTRDATRGTLYFSSQINHAEPSPDFPCFIGKEEEHELMWLMRVRARDGKVLESKRSASWPPFYSRLETNVHAFAALEHNSVKEAPGEFMDAAIHSGKGLYRFPCESKGKDGRCDVATDPHDWLRDPSNGNILLLGVARVYDVVPDRVVLFPRIIEMTMDGDIVFEWKGEDTTLYLPSALKNNPTLNWTDASVRPWLDFAHPNALAFSPDYQSLLLSTRTSDELVLLSRNSGEVLWVLGGSRLSHKSDFEWIGGNAGFSHQHQASFLDDNTILLFDNGNYLHSPPKTKVMEIELDYEHRTAKTVWFYEEERAYSWAEGGVQRLKNGNTLIAWGQRGKGNWLTEVSREKTVVAQWNLPAEYTSYRVHMVEEEEEDYDL